MAPGPTFASFWVQFFPNKPQFTQKDVPDLNGKVNILTGSNTGIGKELSRLLYSRNATVFVAARSEAKSHKAIEDIIQATSSSQGKIQFLHLDLAGLNSVKNAAQTFLATEIKLHVLFNNAGVMVAPVDPPLKTVQGHELATGVDCIGHFLFTKLLTPALVATAKSEQANTVRVVWLSSFGLEIFAAEGLGVDVSALDKELEKPALERYNTSKAGNWALGVEFARRHRSDGIVSVAINPGNLKSGLARDQPLNRFLLLIFGYPVVNGAYTELFAGLSPDVAVDSGAGTENWIIPFGQFYLLRADLPRATKAESEGGTGSTSKFWEWCEERVRPYL